VARLRADRAVLRAFGWTLPVANWCFFLAGLAGAIGTAAGLLPPFSGSWWAKVTTVLLWLLLAREGYEPLAEAAQEASE
jgi:hypothetical protein